VVAGQQEDRHRHIRHCLQRAHHGARVDLVGLEHVAAHAHEERVLLCREPPDGTDGIDARVCEAGLCLPLQEVPRHAQLPVGGQEEAHGLTGAWLVRLA
jgi:hypothetical protein